MRRALLHILLALSLASPAAAAGLAVCERTTHISHGGESGHADRGYGRVQYTEWWSQEGVFTDVIAMDCASGTFLETRTREERISERWFDRQADAAEVFDLAFSTAPSLFSFERLAQELRGTGRDILIAKSDVETCACAVAYPELRGQKTPYEVIQ